MKYIHDEHLEMDDKSCALFPLIKRKFSSFFVKLQLKSPLNLYKFETRHIYCGSNKLTHFYDNNNNNNKSKN